MATDSVAFHARAVLVLIVLVVIIKWTGLFDGLHYVYYAFPSHHQRLEKAIIVPVLYLSLTVVSFNRGVPRRVALTMLGALMFYAAYGAFVKIIHLTMMIDTSLFKVCVRVVMTLLLAWVVNAAWRQKLFVRGGLLASLAIAGIGVIYLNVVSRMNS